MKKTIILFMTIFVSGVAISEENFWYFKIISENTFHYTRILRCDPVNTTVTDEQFTVADAVGPFDEYNQAKEHKENTILHAEKTGFKIKLSTGLCPST